MKQLLFALAILSPGILPAPVAAADDVTDRGVVIRDSVLYADADAASAEVARLVAGSVVDVSGRQGLWMFVTAAGQPQPMRGWLRLTSLRLTGGTGSSPGAASGIGGGFARLSRSVSGLLGGMRGRETRTAHATLGIRGLTPGELQTAGFDAAALEAVAVVAATAEDAELFARAAGLLARDVADLEPAPRAAETPR